MVEVDGTTMHHLFDIRIQGLSKERLGHPGNRDRSRDCTKAFQVYQRFHVGVPVPNGGSRVGVPILRSLAQSLALKILPFPIGSRYLLFGWSWR